MEAAASSVAATRGGGSTLPMSRKQWRVVSEYQRHNDPVRNTSDEELQRSKMPQSDERTIYELGRDSVDLEFCSISVDERVDNGMLQQRIQAIANRRQELLQLEVELRGQVIAKTEISEMQSRFDSKLKEHAEYSLKLQEQINEKDQIIHELERRMEDKDRELHAIKLDNDAAWAKENLFREQNKELATFRRERELSEAERVQHIQQLQELQERMQDKERQIHEFQEQQRTAQETIFLKDEQLKAWISRVQELDALQATTNQSLQAQLRDRTEQYNQLWLGCQRQFVEMERLHLQTIQQIQQEISDARERGGSYSEESHPSDRNIKEFPKFLLSNGTSSEVEAHSSVNSATANTIAENFAFASAGGLPSQVNHVPGVQIPPSLLGVPTFLPHGQMTTLPPYVMHQGIAQPSQPQAAHFHPVQHWQNQQLQQESSQMDKQPSRTEEKYNYMNMHNPLITSSTEDSQLNDSVEQKFIVSSPINIEMQRVSSQFATATQLNPTQQSEIKDQKVSNINMACEDPEERSISIETSLMDEKTLLACIVRTIPPGGRIRITTMLPNRLGKMLAPLHWNDYNTKYGKLDDFVASHPELFLVDGDFIQLREGAQAKIAATTAVAKVAAAAAAPVAYSTYLPSVAVTPIAQSHRISRASSINSTNQNGTVYTANGGISNLKRFNKSMVSQPASGKQN